MRSFYLLIFLSFPFALFSQGTFDDVYVLLQNNCATAGCHSNAVQAGSLDLEGSGASLAVRQAVVYNNLVGEAPNNSVSAAKNHQLVYPGQPYESFLFRKINNGLAPEVSLDAGEGAEMPSQSLPLENEEIELIRQWILYGAPQTGTVADTALISDYYNNNGFNSLQQIPVPPAPGEGFQIHMGPFLLPPSQQGQLQDEVEFFQKYETNLPNDVEVTKIQTFMGNYSHHFILWKFNDGEDNQKGPGLRTDNAHNYTEIVNAVQYAETLELPNGTAFFWKKNTVLDLNSHYINYSTSKSTACEVYVNIYTQPSGTANQEMESEIIPNPFIYIPNDNQEKTFTQQVNEPGIPIPIWIWGLTSHTHQYGTDFNIYLSDAQGNPGMQVFDAGCPGGVPGCPTESYDYQHPPTRYFEPFLQGMLNEGLVSEAKYVNDGPASVSWGETSNDEMMVTLFFYVLDTTGVDFTTGIRQPLLSESLKAFPNPGTDHITIDLADWTEGFVEAQLFDLSGRAMRQYSINSDDRFYRLERDNLAKGHYFLRLSDQTGRMAAARLIFE